MLTFHQVAAGDPSCGRDSVKLCTWGPGASRVLLFLLGSDYIHPPKSLEANYSSPSLVSPWAHQRECEQSCGHLHKHLCCSWLLLPSLNPRRSALLMGFPATQSFPSPPQQPRVQLSWKLLRVSCGHSAGDLHWVAGSLTLKKEAQEFLFLTGTMTCVFEFELS